MMWALVDLAQCIRNLFIHGAMHSCAATFALGRLLDVSNGATDHLRLGLRLVVQKYSVYCLVLLFFLCFILDADI